MNTEKKNRMGAGLRKALGAGAIGLGLVVIATPAVAQDTCYPTCPPPPTIPPTTVITVPPEIPTTTTTIVVGTTTTTVPVGATTTSTTALVGGVTETPTSTTMARVTATTAPQVLGTTQQRTSRLPVTGGDVVGMSVLGAALVAGGALAVRGSRRRHHADA